MNLNEAKSILNKNGYRLNEFMFTKEDDDTYDLLTVYVNEFFKS